jgi:hypothetical protein
MCESHRLETPIEMIERSMSEVSRRMGGADDA